MSMSAAHCIPFLLLLAACEAPAPRQPAPDAEQTVQTTDSDLPGDSARPGAHPTASGDPRTREVVDATLAGDLGRAHQVLTQLLVEEKLARGRELMGAGRARDALLPLDAAIDLDPKSADAAFWHGRAAFETATTDRQPMFFYKDALTDFENAERLGYGVEALFQASRAARMASDSEKALLYARKGMTAIESMAERPNLSPAPEQIAAQAAFGAYVERKAAEADAQDLFIETEMQLGRLAARAPEDAWVWQQLANLYEWEERADDARTAIERGIEISPANINLHNRLVLLARKQGGSEEVQATYAAFRERHPDNGLGHWYPAFEFYEQGIVAYGGTPEEADPELFRRAEQEFQTCRAMQPDFAQSALGYEAMCRAGIGWCEYKAGNLQAAKDAFLSMEDLFEDGLQWEAEGRLGSGVLGLEFVLSQYSLSSDDPDAIVNAAAIADYLHTYLPDDANKANNAGFFNRDAAVLLEHRALVDNFHAKTDGEGEEPRTEEQQREFAERSERLRNRAKELMQRSYSAYAEASRLNPSDVRVINDTGLVMTYYVRSNVEDAERYLRRAVELGEAQLAETTLEGDELIDLQEAWGDAHQNLGVLYLTLRNDPVKAREWFEKCVEIGPAPRAPREFVRDYWIAACDGDEEAQTKVRRQIWDEARYN
ncbi:MAG: tetratricopeptide (TPR) repeat protein [Chlamydiales bacterium]|jgi:tetratricopeptide (TPR) repeat protein